MSAGHRPRGVPRRTWRAAVVLFLVVFLGGLGVTGASALWSGHGTVQAKVTTGTWTDTLQPGWTWNPAVQVKDSNRGPHHRVVLGWTPPTTGAATYSLALTGDHRPQNALKANHAVPAGAGWILEFHQHDSPGQFDVVLTATVNGTTSAPVYRRLTLHDDGSATVQTILR